MSILHISFYFILFHSFFLQTSSRNASLEFFYPIPNIITSEDVTFKLKNPFKEGFELRSSKLSSQSLMKPSLFLGGRQLKKCSSRLPTFVLGPKSFDQGRGNSFGCRSHFPDWSSDEPKFSSFCSSLILTVVRALLNLLSRKDLSSEPFFYQ